jgi:hypothetical protein
VEQVESFKVLGVQITKDLKWSTLLQIVAKKVRQHLFPLRRLIKCGMVPQFLTKLYSCTIESILIGCITAWYGDCTTLDRMELWKVVRTAHYITGAKLPAIQDLYFMQCERNAHEIGKDSSHPGHRLFSLHPQAKWYWSNKSDINRLLNSFYSKP